MNLLYNINVEFLKDFDTTYKNVPNKIFDSILSKSIEDLSNINFYGHPGSFKNLYPYYLIKKLTGTYNTNTRKIVEKLVINNNVVEFELILNDNFIEINPSLYGFYDKFIITNYIQNLIKIRNITQRKHIILFRDLDKLSNNSYMTLRRILEKYSNNTLFIFTSTNISCINEAIISRCQNIRCTIETEKNLKNFLSFYIEDKNNIKKIIQKSNRDINKIMFMHSKINSDEEQKLILQNSIKEQIQFIKKTKDFLKVIKENRNFLNQILNFSYNNEEIIQEFKIILLKIFKKYQSKISLVFDLLRELDANLINAQKDFFAYEQFLLKLYKIIHFDT
jgi:DNA polymerase III delta prime subunit